MRSRLMLAAALAAVTVLPAFSAGAQHCSIPIYLFSNFRVQTGVEDPTTGNELQPGNPTATSSAIGCTVIAEDFPETDFDDSDTDYIYPGSNNFSVRWLEEGSVPASGTLEFAGETYVLQFKAGGGTTGDQTDSQRIFFDPALSFDGGEAVITVCRDAGGDDCETRTYRTIDQGPR